MEIKSEKGKIVVLEKFGIVFFQFNGAFFQQIIMVIVCFFIFISFHFPPSTIPFSSNFVLTTIKDEVLLLLYIIKIINSAIFHSIPMFSITKDPGSTMKLYYEQTKQQLAHSAHRIPQISKYRKDHHVKVESQKMKMIQDRIISQENAAVNLQNRIENSDYYLKYDYNPFGKMKKNLQEQQQRRLTQINMVDKLNEKQQKKGYLPQFSKLTRKNLIEIEDKAEMFSKKKLNQIEREKYEKTEKANKMHQISSSQPIDKIQLQQDQLEIQDIAKIQDSNFFFQNKPNIFKIARGQLECVSADDHLLKRNFSFSSVIAKDYNYFKENLYRGLSRLGRGTICSWYKGKQRIQDYINSSQSRIFPEHLRFDDLLNIATNRLSSQIISRMTNQKGMRPEQEEKESDEQDLDQNFMRDLFLKNRLKNQQIEYRHQNEQKIEIQMYKNLQLNQKQEEYRLRMNKNIQQIDIINQIRSKIWKITIKDKQQHNKLSQQSKQKVGRLIQRIMKNQASQEQTELNKTVRLKKANSNKNGVIGLRLTNETLGRISDLQKELEQN